MRAVDSVASQLAQLHYHLRVYWLDSHHLSSLQILDECVSEIKDYALGSTVDLTDKDHVMDIFIDTLYTAITSLHCNNLAKVDKLSHLYYQMVMCPEVVC